MRLTIDKRKKMIRKNKKTKTCQARMVRVHGNPNINQIVKENNQIVQVQFQDKEDLVHYNQLIQNLNK
jgi:hypothetical protein